MQKLAHTCNICDKRYVELTHLAFISLAIAKLTDTEPDGNTFMAATRVLKSSDL